MQSPRYVAKYGAIRFLSCPGRAGIVSKFRAVSGTACKMPSPTPPKSAKVELRLGNRVELVLAALMRAGGDRFRGIRSGAAWDADTSLLNPVNPAPPGLLGDKTFREGFAVLGRLGLSFDALVLHPQLNDVANLAGAFPDTKIVLNHVGRLVGIGAYAGKLSDQFPRWAASIKALAAHENVYVKVGELGQALNRFGIEKEAEPPSSELVANALRPHLETS